MTFQTPFATHASSSTHASLTVENRSRIVSTLQDENRSRIVSTLQDERIRLGPDRTTIRGHLLDNIFDMLDEEDRKRNITVHAGGECIEVDYYKSLGPSQIQNIRPIPDVALPYIVVPENERNSSSLLAGVSGQVVEEVLPNLSNEAESNKQEEELLKLDVTTTKDKHLPENENVDEK